jgi:subtilase family serine protease
MLFVLNTSGVPAVAKIVSVPQYLPDLIVTSLSYDPTTGLFTSVVTNQGTAATPAGVPVGVSYSVDGVKQTWGVVNGPLAAGASVTIGTGGGAYAIPSGTHTITAFADDINRFAESNEANNTFSQTITVP